MENSEEKIDGGTQRIDGDITVVESKHSERVEDSDSDVFHLLKEVPSSSVATHPQVTNAKQKSGALKASVSLVGALGRSSRKASSGNERALSEEQEQITLHDDRHDHVAQTIIERLDRLELYNNTLQQSLGGYKVATDGATRAAGNAGRSLNEFRSEVEVEFNAVRERLAQVGEDLQNVRQKVNHTDSDLAAILTKLDMTSVNLVRQLEELTQEISGAVREYEATKDELKVEQGDQTSLEQKAKAKFAEIDELAAKYLKLKVEDALRVPNVSLRAQTLSSLKEQLEEIATRKQDNNPQATSRWSGWFSTNKEKKAFDSVERFAKNPALSPRTTKENFDVNAELLRTMISATYALTYFDKVYTVPAASTSGSASVNASVRLSVSTPTRNSTMALGLASASTPASQQLLEVTDMVNKAVLLHVRDELKKLQARTDGLIGSQSPTMQFWGKVLLALALAIAATVAAIALMSALGFALPTFLVPYVAYLQASALVSNVLTFVSTQLSITVAASASATALLTAGIFGGVGYGLNRAGAPSSLKKDLDHAAKDLDDAIADTPAFRAIRVA